MTAPRVLIVGLDAAEPELIERWAAEGAMPNLRALMAAGRWGHVENPRGLESGSAWPTFVTGRRPDEHGQYFGGRRFNSETYRHELIGPDYALCDPFWVRLSQAGKRVAVVDPPYSFVDERVNGVILCDWTSHARSGDGQFHAWPRELEDEILAAFGDDPFGRAAYCPADLLNVETAADVDRFVEMCERRLAAKTDCSLFLMRREPWDLFFTVLHEAHDAGHMCWHVHDPAHPRHDPAVAQAVEDPVRRVYAAIDRAIGRLLEAASADTRVLVFSSHGMGPNYTGTYLLDRILERLERLDNGGRPRTAYSALRDGWRRVAPPRLRHRLFKLRRSRLKTIRTSLGSADNARRAYFETLLSDRTGGVRLNLKGREAHGLVEPGAEADRLCARIAEALSEVVNLETGEPLVEEVVRTADLYPGEALPRLPDLLVTWNRRAPIRRVHSPRVGTLDQPYPFVRSGDHLPVGMFFAKGPGLRSGKRNAFVRSMDFAPTVAHWLDVPLPPLEPVEL